MWDYYPFKIAFTPFDHILEAKVHCRGEIRARDLTETRLLTITVTPVATRGIVLLSMVVIIVIRKKRQEVETLGQSKGTLALYAVWNVSRDGRRETLTRSGSAC